MNKIDELIKENEKLKSENKALKSRCGIFTGGGMCLVCPMECEKRKMAYGGDKIKGETDKNGFK